MRNRAMLPSCRLITSVSTTSRFYLLPTQKDRQVARFWKFCATLSVPTESPMDVRDSFLRDDDCGSIAELFENGKHLVGPYA